MPLRNINSERWGSRYRSAASHHSTTLHMSIEVFGDATASHKSAEGRSKHYKSAEGRSKHYEWSQLIVVEKREAVKRECARAPLLGHPLRGQPSAGGYEGVG